MINIDNLVIEVTRKCNLKCEHCLRGKAQNKCITQQIIYNIFSKLDYVGTLTITGGEPSLAVEQIEMITQNIRYGNCKVGNFYIVTNAKYLTTRFFEALEDLYRVCTENEISQIQYSSDRFHYNQKHINRLEEYFEYRGLVNGCDEGLVSGKGEIYSEGVINQGYAKENGIARKELKQDKFRASSYEDEVSLNDNELYINVNGDIIVGCDWSYETQEEIKIGNICEISGNALVNLLEQKELITWED